MSLRLSRRRFRSIAAAFIAAGVTLLPATPGYADPTPPAAPASTPSESPQPSSPSGTPDTTPHSPTPHSPAPSSPSPTGEPASHDLLVGGGLWRGRVGQDVGATIAVNTDGARRFRIGIEIAPGARIRTSCDRVADGYCWFDKTATDQTHISTFRFGLRAVGTHEVNAVVQPIGYTDPNPDNDRTTLTFVVTEPATGHDMSVTGATVSSPVGEEVTAQVPVDRAGVSNYTFVFRYDPRRLENRSVCHETRRVGELVECLFLPPGYHGPVHYLTFRVLTAGDTVVPVEVHGGRGEDPNPRNNTATVTVTGLAPQEPGGGAGSGGDDGGALPVTGTPVTLLAASGVGLLTAGVALFAVARRQATKAASIA